MGDYLDDGIYELANAIVLQAAKDYKDALRRLDGYDCDKLERFFLSDYFMELTRDKISGHAIIKELKRQSGMQSRMLKRRRAKLKGDLYGE